VFEIVPSKIYRCKFIVLRRAEADEIETRTDKGKTEKGEG
jgi:hypothetical protein